MDAQSLDNEHPDLSMFKRAFYDTEEGQMHYRRSRNDNDNHSDNDNDNDNGPQAQSKQTKTTIVLLHMQPYCGLEFAKVMPTLAQEYDVIVPDLFGFGNSADILGETNCSGEASLPSIETFAKHQIQLLDHLKIDKAIFLGNHTGASVAGEVAASYPNRVSKLILIGARFFSEIGGPEMSKENQERFLQGWELQADGNHLMKRWNARAKLLPPGVNHKWVLEDGKHFNRPQHAIMAIEKYKESALSKWGNIKANTLLIWVDDEKQIFDLLGLKGLVKNEELVNKSIKGADVAHINGGMMIFQSHPQVVLNKVLDFLH